MYSAVPRSSQWPSIVTCQVGILLQHRGVGLQHLLAVGAHVGAVELEEQRLSGESRLRSSSDFEPIVSSAGSAAPAPARSPAAAAPAAAAARRRRSAGGGGIGRATGGCLLRARADHHRQQHHQNHQRCSLLRLITDPQNLNLVGTSWNPWNLVDLATATNSASVLLPSLRDLPQVAAVAVDREDLAAARARRHERQVPAVRRPRRALVGAFAERDLPRLAGARCSGS